MTILILVLFGLMNCLIHTSGLEPELDQQWEQYKVDFYKNYSSTEEEDERRLIWETAVQEINKHNEEAENGQHSYTQGINAFTDMMPQEFAKAYTTSVDADESSIKQDEISVCPENADFPDSYNWVDQGVVTHVKYMGPCESSWAFSATGSLEGQQALKTQKLVSLSEQNLLDCVKNISCDHDGEVSDAFKYIRDNGGIDTEESYCYRASVEECKYDPKNSGATLSSWKYIAKGDEKALQCAVATVGPISARMFMGAWELRRYKSGVYSNWANIGKTPDHTVLIVGYGKEYGKPYWLIKNCWSDGWGLDGYIKIERNVNMCSIASKALFPVT